MRNRLKHKNNAQQLRDNCVNLNESSSSSIVNAQAGVSKGFFFAQLNLWIFLN